MTVLKIKDLSTETKKMHESQNKWRRRNWEKTLKENKESIEKLISKINLFDIWSNKLLKIPPAKLLLREIFMDAYISIHFAGFGLYKYAHMCLRSELETALRLIYFSTHNVEFNWWSEENEWYREKRNWPDVWGRGYEYFVQLGEIKDFEKLCDDNRKLFGGDTGISGIHKELSKFIHSGAGHLQTRSDRVSPKYDSNEFRKWQKTHEIVQIYIHIILALGFAGKFKDMTSTQRNKILNIGMNDYYKERVKSALNL